MVFLKKNWTLLLITILSLIPLINLLNPGLPISHDGEDHIYRIASFYQSLSEGNIIPRWSGNLNWGYGHPIFMFLYPLPSYSASLLHFLGLGIIDSYKIILATSFVLSGIFMFSFLKEITNEKSALVGSVLFLFAPYRFVDLYVRGAIGEHVAFLFMPLILYFILKIFKLKPKENINTIYIYFILLSISFAGFILSHNAISLIFFPFIIAVSFALFINFKSFKSLLITFFSISAGFLFSLFFWLPAFIEGKYTLRDIVTKNIYADRFVDVKDLLYAPWSFGQSGELSVQLGIVQLIILIFSFIIIFKKYKTNYQNNKLYFISIFFFIVSVFLMLQQSNFIWEKITTLQKLQFPWRFLSLTTFSLSVIGAITFSKINTKYFNPIFGVVVASAVIISISFWQAKEYRVIDESKLLQSYAGTTDTGESSPIWSVRSMDQFPKSEIEIISGKGEIINIKRNFNNHSYLISNKENIRIRENTLYFPGWNLYVNNQKEEFEFQDPSNQGLITFNLEPGLNHINLKFEETKLRLTSNIISVSSIIIFLFIPIIFYIFKKFLK